MVRNPALWAALILLVIVLFGAKRLPDAVKSVAQSLKAFKSEMEPDSEDAKNKGESSNTDKI
jgi:sec-independent protein translocase protein TatA